MKQNEDIFKNEELLNAVEQLKKGNEDAFATIYDKTYKYVYSRAKCMFKDEQEALDLVQEVYLSVYRNIDSLKSNESLYAWLRTVTFQQGTKLLRKNRKELLLTEETQEFFDEVTDDGQETGKELYEQEDVKAIRECIDRLSDEQRTVVLAYYYDNLKVDEIAKELEISVGTAKSRLHLARKNLKLHIEEQEKKQGYKLHSFGGFTFAIVLSSMMEENMNISDGAMQSTFKSICGKLGIVVKGVSKGMKTPLLTKIAGLGGKKLVAVTIATVAVTGTIGVAGATLIDNGNFFHSHEYVEEVTIQATCENNGEKTFTCKCGDNYTEVIVATGHTFDEYISNEDATYFADGTETAKCTCGLEDTRVITGSKLEYSFEELEKTMYIANTTIVYDMPCEEGEEIGELSKAQEVTVTGQCIETEWYRICFGDEIGYVSSGSLVNENPNNISKNEGQTSNKTPTAVDENGGWVDEDGYYCIGDYKFFAHGYEINLDDGWKSFYKKLADGGVGNAILIDRDEFGGRIYGIMQFYEEGNYSNGYELESYLESNGFFRPEHILPGMHLGGGYSLGYKNGVLLDYENTGSWYTQEELEILYEEYPEAQYGYWDF